MIYKYKNIRFLIQGRGEPIIFFHGFGQTPFFYETILNELSESYLVIAPFLSDLDNFDDQLNNLLKEFIKNKIKTKKVNLIGHSMGASLVLKFVFNNKSKVKKIILFNGLLIKQKLNLIKWSFNMIYDFFINGNLFFDLKQLIKSFLIMTKNFIFNNKNFIYQIKYCLTFNLIDQIKNQMNKDKIPILILSSKNDQLISLESIKKANILIKNSKLKIFKGNHIWFLKNPKKTVQLIKKFFMYEDKSISKK